MTRLCYLKCDRCQFEYQKSGCGLSEDGRGYERAENLLRDAAADGWDTSDSYFCPRCLPPVRPPGFAFDMRTIQVLPPTDLTWD